jgi:Protein of unknown function (DUF2953)
MWLVLAVLAVALAAVLFVPVTIELSIVTQPESSAARVSARIGWLVFSLRTPRAGGDDERPPAARPATPGRKTRRPGRGHAGAMAVLRSPGVLRRCARLGAELLRRLWPDRIRIEARVGLDDPADTGMLVGWGYALHAFAPTRQGSSFRLEPDFSGAVFMGRADLRWSRSMASLLWPVVTFLSSPVVWRAAIRAGRSARR